MKKRYLALLFAALMLLCVSAAAQTLPSNDCFSPGMMRLAEKDDLALDASFTVEDAFYARDLSVLNAMLSGTTFHYDRVGEAEALSIEREGEKLFSAALTQSGSTASLGFNGQQFDVSGAVPARQQEPLYILERVPLEEVAGWIESLNAVADPFVVQRTMSDDGTRLTKIEISGALMIGGERWTVEGFLRQPAGRAPKDTFEVTVRHDKDNYIEFLYSALREKEVEQKDRKGEVRVTTTLKAAGKIGGYDLSSRLSVHMKNNWTADDDGLSEKITLSATLTHQDKNPVRHGQHLDDVRIENRNVIRVKSGEEGLRSFSDESELHAVMDGQNFLGGTMQLTLRENGEIPPSMTGTEGTDIQKAFEQAVEDLSGRLYRQMDSAIREKIGL